MKITRLEFVVSYRLHSLYSKDTTDLFRLTPYGHGLISVTVILSLPYRMSIYSQTSFFYLHLQSFTLFSNQFLSVDNKVSLRPFSIDSRCSGLFWQISKLFLFYYFCVKGSKRHRVIPRMWLDLWTKSKS